MGGLRRHRVGLSWLGIVALLGNVLVGAFCHAPSTAGALADEFLGSLIICTSEGAKTVPHGGNAPQPQQVDHCAICSLIAGLSAAVALVFAAIAFELSSVARPMQVGLRTLADHLILGGIRSRAPPLAA
jgi:hypothetical protein